MKMKGQVKYNGNHYFCGDYVFGEYKQREGKHFIVDEYEDKYGNEFKNEVEVFKHSLGKLRETP